LAEIEARNQIDNRIYQAEKLVRENRDKLAEADVKAVEEAVEAGRKAMADGNVEAMRSTGEQIERATHRIAEAMYKTNAAAQGAPSGGSGQPGPQGGGSGGNDGAKPGPAQGDVIDAEYVDVEEGKKPN
jgi:molecular chaperone DnaK